MFLVANVFGIKFDAISSGLLLTDNLGFPIPKNMLADIVKKFHNGSMFYINVDFQISSSLQGNISVVTVSVSLINNSNNFESIYELSLYRCWKVSFVDKIKRISC